MRGKVVVDEEGEGLRCGGNSGASILRFRGLEVEREVVIAIACFPNEDERGFVVLCQIIGLIVVSTFDAGQMFVRFGLIYGKVGE